jgi:flagellin-specific chaperone FliS
VSTVNRNRLTLTLYQSCLDRNKAADCLIKQMESKVKP